MDAAQGYPHTVDNGAGETLVVLGVESTPEGERNRSAEETPSRSARLV